MENIVILRFFQNKIDIFRKEESLTLNISNNDLQNIYSSFVEIAEKDKDCFNILHPWNDLKEIKYNNCVIIAYNVETFLIQGWCTMYYKDFNTRSGINVLYLYIDILVTRSVPKVNKLGTYFMDFIKNNCMNINYKEEINKNVDIMFLYSFDSTKSFYKKFKYLTCYQDNDNFTFYHINKLSMNKSKFFIKDIEIFWDFENNAFMEEDVKEQYNKNITEIQEKYGEKCSKPKDKIEFYNKDFQNKLYNHTIPTSLFNIKKRAFIQQNYTKDKRTKVYKN